MFDKNLALKPSTLDKNALSENQANTGSTLSLIKLFDCIGFKNR